MAETSKATEVGERSGTAMPAPYRTADACTLSELLLRASGQHRERLALIVADERVTYGELAERAWLFARSLVALGVRPRNHVCVWLPNSVDYVVAMFGTAMAGAVFVPLSTRYRSSELAFVLADAGPVCLVTTNAVVDYVDFVAVLKSAFPGLDETQDPGALALAAVPPLRSVVVLDGDGGDGTLSGPSFAAAAEAADNDKLARWCTGTPVRAPAAVIYTSGTTSQPRGAILTHEALVRHWATAGRLWRLTPEDRFWNPCPMFHIAGIGPIIWTFAHGATLISDTYFDPERGLAQIARERATAIYPTYPPIMTALMTHPRFATTDLSSVRAMLNVAPPDDLRATQAAIPDCAQITLYGSTEGGPVTMNHIDDDAESRAGTNGHPLPGVELRIVDTASCEELPAYASGEILYRGHNTFSGYLNDAEKSAATIDPEGWVHTGDLGSLTDDGALRFSGRVTEMLKVGGENLAPAELEEFLATHPAVKLVQVIGIPDDRLVEVPVAFVELVHGEETTEEDLVAYCRGRIASYKVPRMVRIVSEWPMSATKIQRSKLREQLLIELGLEY